MAGLPVIRSARRVDPALPHVLVPPDGDLTGVADGALAAVAETGASDWTGRGKPS
jgi:hypothetical protein